MRLTPARLTEPTVDAAGGRFYSWPDIDFDHKLTELDLTQIETHLNHGLRERPDKSLPLQVLINGYGFTLRDSHEVRLIRNAMNAGPAGSVGRAAARRRPRRVVPRHAACRFFPTQDDPGWA
jgi:hypothetical protein